MKAINGMTGTKVPACKESSRPLSRGEQIADAWVHKLAIA